MNIRGKVYLVGGAVRDTVMGLEPKDRDYVVVGGSEENMLSNGFKKVGADFPVFLHPETGEEYALARVERKSGLGYNGFTVETEGVTLEQDLSRRDFTMNAMAMDSEGNIFDPFNGQGDIAKKILRHTSYAFSEDPIRALRAFRFALRYDMTIASLTQNMIHRIPLNDYDALVPERLLLEFEKASADHKLFQFSGLVCHFGLGWLTEKLFGDVQFAEDSNDENEFAVSVVWGLFNSIKDGKNISDFNGIAHYKKLAQKMVNYHNTGYSVEGLYNLVKSTDSRSDMRIIRRAFMISNENLYGKTWLMRYLIKKVNADYVKKIRPALKDGPELGAAIKEQVVVEYSKELEEL